jgi:hypothetical protein
VVRFQRRGSEGQLANLDSTESGSHFAHKERSGQSGTLSALSTCGKSQRRADGAANCFGQSLARFAYPAGDPLGHTFWLGEHSRKRWG